MTRMHAKIGIYKKETEIGLSVVDWIGLAEDRYRW
jgi:hypothetical protein